MKPMRGIFALLAPLALAAVTVAAATAQAVAADERRNLTVVELFTSQGCNSCPPADRLLGELIDRRDDLLGLSFHVNYWDYIGWKDAFALDEAVVRQRNYVGRAGGRYAYTPQMVIGGEAHVVGSREDAVSAKIDWAARKRGDVGISTSALTNGMVRIELTAKHQLAPAAIWLVHFDDRHDVQIGAGENAGKLLTYRNVVRGLENIATWDGRADLALEIDLQKARAAAGDAKSSAVLVQTDRFGPIIGAVRLNKSSE